MSLPPEPNTQHPAPSSLAPVMVAAGLTLAFFGLVTATLAFGVVGVLTLLAGIAAWVKELADGS